jgi:hypothetical protein
LILGAFYIASLVNDVLKLSCVGVVELWEMVDFSYLYPKMEDELKRGLLSKKNSAFEKMF